MSKYYFTIYNSTAPDGFFESIEANNEKDAQALIMEIYPDAMHITLNQ